MSEFGDLLRQIRILPVLTIADTAQALKVCGALRDGGIRAVEITLRTPAALDCIGEVGDTYPDLLVGAGTVKTVADLERIAERKAGFAVSPGFSAELGRAADALGMPLLPGIATASELMQGLASGREEFKLFPAQAAGGMALLRAFAAPFPEARFCPTGGIGSDNYQDYLSLPNVVCVGGSWMVNQALIEAQDWEEISRLAAAALS